MSDVPAGWATAALGDVASWGSGGTPTRTVHRYYGGEIPWAVIGDLNDGVVSQCSTAITEEGLRESSAKLVPPGTVLIAMYGSIGKLGIAGVEMATNQAIAFATPISELLDRRYLFHYLASQRDRLTSVGKGATQQNIGQAVLKAWPIPVPPLAEQDRIVGAIEEHLSRLDAADRLLQQASLRLAHLEEAIEGRLLVGLWPLEQLATVSEFVTDGDHRPPPRVATGVPHLTARSVRNGRLSLEGCTFVSEEGYRQTSARYKPIEGDVIVTCVGTVGEVAVVPAGLRFSADRNLAAVRLARDAPVTPEFMAAVLSTRPLKRTLQTASGSTAQPHLYLRDLRAVEIPVPPLREQEALVAELDYLTTGRQHLESSLVAARHRAQGFRRSLLSAAFSGQLIPQDPADEPASVLLERVRSERTSNRATRRSGKVAAS